MVSVVFRGRNQKYAGEYTLTLTENAGNDGMVTVDRLRAFMLVARQNSVVSQADSGCCCGCNVDVETVELTTELQIPSLGKGVVRVYNIARSVWGSGLETDGESVSVRIASDSGDVLSVDSDGLHIKKEALEGGGMSPISPDEIDSMIKVSGTDAAENENK